VSNILHDAYAALLAGVTYRTGNEIHWYDENGHQITVEPVDVERESYKIRYYRRDGGLKYETDYLQGKIHGKSVAWYIHGQKYWEADYCQGKLHGKNISWHTNGQIRLEEYYCQNQRHGKHIAFYSNGQAQLEANYYKGQRHGLSITWCSDGQLYSKCYYINGDWATLEEWEQHNDSTT